MTTPSDNRPRLLYVTSQMPWPLNSGGHLRSYHILKSLAEEFSICVVTAHDADGAGAAALGECGIQCRVVQKKRGRVGEALHASVCAVLSRPYVMYCRHDYREIREAVAAAVDEFSPDLVYLDHLDSCVFSDLCGVIPTVVDLHNVYSIICERLADERGFPVSAYLRREARLLREAEQHAVDRCRMVFAVSTAEQSRFRSLGAEKCPVIPNGVDCSRYAHLPAGRESGPPVILHLGSMAWEPNVEAAEFLARETMPQLRESVPDAVLQIVGRSPVSRVTVLDRLPGVEVHGSVPDVMPYIQNATVMAVPLDSGGGTRLKILEAFAAGLPVVSTGVGCEGIDCEHQRDLLICERSGFTDGLVEALRDRTAAVKLAQSARRLAESSYDWGAIGSSARSELLGLIQSLKSDSVSSSDSSSADAVDCSSVR